MQNQAVLLTFSSDLPSPSSPRRSIAEGSAPVSAQINRCCSAAATAGAQHVSLSQSPRSCSSPSAPICRHRRRLVAASLKVALPQHFAATRGLFRPDASANFGSVYERCESTHDCFCQACNAPADILQKVSQMNLGIQPRYCDTSTGKNLQQRKRQRPCGALLTCQ